MGRGAKVRPRPCRAPARADAQRRTAGRGRSRATASWSPAARTVRGRWSRSCRQAGAEALLLPLIDFERAADQQPWTWPAMPSAPGSIDWLVVSSATTVHGAADQGRRTRQVALRQWIPAATRVAAVGPASTASAPGGRRRGGRTWCRQHEQSAAGLAGVWPAGPATVLLPQADIAAPALAQGLRRQGARRHGSRGLSHGGLPGGEPGRRLAARRERPAAPATRPPSYARLTPKALPRSPPAGLHAVVAASPSAARRIHARFPRCAPAGFVAIGTATAAAAAALGLTVAATAAEATPAGLVAAVIRAVASRDSTQPRHPFVSIRHQ